MGGDNDFGNAYARWCVLRTSGPRTLPLFRSMEAAGLDVWTPVKVIERRQGRSRDRVDVDAPIMPTFVFAREALVPELLALSSSPINPHPSFSIFRYNGAIPLVRESEIEALRTEEGRAILARRRKERHAFAAGQGVKVPDGPFAGLSGIVKQDTSGRYALVCFGEWEINIATFLLQSDGLEQNKPIMGAAA